MLSNYPNVDILVNGNQPIKQYAHKGKVFIESRDGIEYSIRIRNDGHARILAVVSVDGINVIDGELASPDGAGYIIAGYSSYTIKGFRTSNDSVNAFKFSRKDKSYAAKSESTSGDTSNCGVIGVQLYYEKVSYCNNWQYPYHYWSNPIWTTTNHNPQYLCRSMSTDGNVYCASIGNFDMGTEFSEKEVTDKVTNEDFVRGVSAGQLELYYASRASLEAMGIRFDKAAAVSFPQAFPKASYCKPPKN
jgi:hypothetical protein